LLELGLGRLLLDSQAQQAEGLAVAVDQWVLLSLRELGGVPVDLFACLEVAFPAVDGGVFGVAVER